MNVAVLWQVHSSLGKKKKIAFSTWHCDVGGANLKKEKKKSRLRKKEPTKWTLAAKLLGLHLHLVDIQSSHCLQQHSDTMCVTMHIKSRQEAHSSPCKAQLGFQENSAETYGNKSNYNCVYLMVWKGEEWSLFLRLSGWQWSSGWVHPPAPQRITGT